MNGRFEISDVKIGQGASGGVAVGRDRHTGIPVAIKILADDELAKGGLLRELRREIQIHGKLNHKNIIQLYGVDFDEKHTLLFMELAPGGDLFNYVNGADDPIPVNEIKKYTKMIISALKYINEQKCLIHRDLKGENLVFGMDGELKLIDFGISAKTCSNRLKQEPLGTLGYIPPEAYAKEAERSVKIDCFALGCIVYLLLTGLPPFELTEEDRKTKDDQKDTIEKINKEGYDFASAWKPAPEISAGARKFVANLLKPDPTQRYDLDMALNDDWLKSD